MDHCWIQCELAQEPRVMPFLFGTCQVIMLLFINCTIVRHLGSCVQLQETGKTQMVAIMCLMLSVSRAESVNLQGSNKCITTKYVFAS